MVINIEQYLTEIRMIMSMYPQYDVDSNFLEIFDGPLNTYPHLKTSNPPKEWTIAVALNQEMGTGKKRNGILFKKNINDNDISNTKGAIGFDKRNKQWDYKIVKKLLPLLNTNLKFIQHLTLHEIAHHKGYNQTEEYECDKWAFNEMVANRML